jgi:hypothetical protein
MAMRELPCKRLLQYAICMYWGMLESQGFSLAWKLGIPLVTLADLADFFTHFPK